MKKSALFISMIVGVSTLIQILTQIIVTRIFGAKVELDTFLAAVALPTIIVSAIYGTLSDTIIPLIKKEKDEDIPSYIFCTAIYLGLIGLVVSIILSHFSREITVLLYGTEKTSFINQTAFYTFYLIYSIPFALVNTVFGAYLYSRKKFLLFPSVQLVGTILGLCLTIWLAPTLGIVSLVIAFFLSLLIQLPFIFPKVPRISLSFKKAQIGILILSWVPLIISNFAVSNSTLIMRSFSSHLPVGYIVYVNLASKLFAAAVGIMTIGIQTIFLPHLVDLIHSHEVKKIETQVVKAKFAAWVVSLGVIIFIILVAPFFMRLILVGGKFTAPDVEKLIAIFPYFIAPAMGWGISQVYFQPLIALRKQYKLAILNVGAAALGWFVAFYVQSLWGDLYAIMAGLTVLLFTGIIGAEILWIKEKRLLLSK